MIGSLYAVYLTGTTGSTLALLFIGSGFVSGADLGGMNYNGTYRRLEDGSLEGALEYVIPPQTSLITGGGGTSNDPIKIDMPLRLPASFSDGQTVRIDTPLGPVNGRFEKLRDIENP